VKRQPDSLNDILRNHVQEFTNAITAAVRQNVASEISTFLKNGNGHQPRKSRIKRRIMGCIAPSCKNPSKGPRFHYLCDKHMEAPKKEWQAWRAAKAKKD
jgi:hypothetical protein